MFNQPIIYTGIGSREAPLETRNLATKIAFSFAHYGHKLRSGKAGGMDEAFQLGIQQYCDKPNFTITLEDALKLAEIYIPWRNFKNPVLWDYWDDVQGDNQEAEYIARNIHPAWERCSQGARKLHTRNICQILGKDLKTPSNVVIFAAPEYRGIVKGGTATAVNLAREHNILTVNMLQPNWQYPLIEMGLTCKLPKETP